MPEMWNVLQKRNSFKNGPKIKSLGRGLGFYNHCNGVCKAVQKVLLHVIYVPNNIKTMSNLTRHKIIHVEWNTATFLRVAKCSKKNLIVLKFRHFHFSEQKTFGIAKVLLPATRDKYYESSQINKPLLQFITVFLYFLYWELCFWFHRAANSVYNSFTDFYIAEKHSFCFVIQISWTGSIWQSSLWLSIFFASIFYLPTCYCLGLNINFTFPGLH